MQGNSGSITRTIRICPNIGKATKHRQTQWVGCGGSCLNLRLHCYGRCPDFPITAQAVTPRKGSEETHRKWSTVPQPGPAGLPNY